MNPLTDYLKPLTREEVFRALLSLAAAVGLTTTAWKSGDMPRGLLSIFSGFIASTWNAAVLPVLCCFFLDYATGPLFRVAAKVFWGVQPKGQTLATGELTVENRDLVPHTIVAGDLAAKNVRDKVFRNVTDGFLAAWSGNPGDPFPTLTLDFQAVEPGTVANTGAGEILEEPARAPAGVYFVANTQPLLGQDEESEADLKRRIRASVGLLSPAGPRAAYEFVALSTRVPGFPANTEEGRTLVERLLVTRDDDVAVNVNRVRVVPSAGTVDVILASPAGEATGDATTVGTDVYLVNQAVQLLVAPAGITATVRSAAEVPVARTLDVRILRESNLTEADAAAALDVALERFFQDHPIGGRRLTPGGQGFLLMRELEASVKTHALKAAFEARVAGGATPEDALTAATGFYYVSASGIDEPLEEDEVATSAVTYTITTVTQQS